MDKGRFMFVVVIPPQFEATFAPASAGYPLEYRRHRHAAGRHRRQLHQEHHQRPHRQLPQSHGCSFGPQPVNLVVRKMFNPNGVSSWFTSVVAIINQVTLLTVVLCGAAVIREREHGTLEHLLVMPLTAFEIAMAKVWANGLVILVATGLSLFLVVMMALQVPFAGSIPLWFCGVVLYLFFATALGIFLGTISRPWRSSRF
jgi:ABC-2 type transport system permease protein